MKRSTKTGVGAGTMAVLLALTSFLNGLQSAKRESCTLKVDSAHISKYAKMTDGERKLKIKARTECNNVQKYSVISMEFYEVISGRKDVVRSFDPIMVSSDRKRPKNAYFESFEEFCINNSEHRYYGEASGTVYMESGKLIKVSGTSEKSTTLRCGIVAK